MTESGARMRWAVPGDAERIADYHHQCWVLAYAPIVSKELMSNAKPRLERWRNWLDDETNFTTVVAVDGDDTAIAHTTVRDHELLHLFVDPAHHRLGLGRQLLEVGERLIRQAGHQQARLSTRVGNTPAITLYELQGWHMTDELESGENEFGVPYTEHVMRKDFSVRNHVRANRDTWTADAPNWVDRGRRSWGAEPHWGEMSIPETEVQILPDLKGRDVVELGCGTGYVSAWCLRSGARSAVGLDNSIAQLQTAQTLQAEFDVDLPLVWGNAEQLPFDDKSFDVAINEYGAAMWCDPHRWVAEAARVLRPGGQLVFLTWSSLMSMSAPDFDHQRTSTQLLRPQRDLHRVVFPDTDGVEFALSHGDWISLLRSHGFRVDRLAELYAPREGGPERYSYYDASWARRWPPEEMWVGTLSNG